MSSKFRRNGYTYEVDERRDEVYSDDPALNKPDADILCDKFEENIRAAIVKGDSAPAGVGNIWAGFDDLVDRLEVNGLSDLVLYIVSGEKTPEEAGRWFKEIIDSETNSLVELSCERVRNQSENV
ncbi:MAG: hypothetical protein BV459_04975 [Thermoplasmata archaeon M11B2D]|nr:MAG: hypothetical protein BV459_04975 [Thermoplasmata archaeon M11B2D]